MARRIGTTLLLVERRTTNCRSLLAALPDDGDYALSVSH